jgi:LysR family nod box-dependent transcriptional activator
MRVEGLDLNLLILFNAILEEGSVTAAATSLKISTAAASNALRRLRTHYEDKLLVYEHGEMVPTTLGAQLAEELRNLVGRAHTLARARSVFNPAVSERSFVISMSDHLSYLLMEKICLKMSVEAPRATLDVCALSADPAADITNQECDLVLLRQNQLAAGFPSMPIMVDDYAVLTWRDRQPSASKLSSDDYIRGAHIVYNEPSASQILDDYERFGVEPGHFVAAVPYLMVLPHAIVGTDLIATVERRLAEKAARSLPLEFAPLPFAAEHIVTCAYWNQLAEREPGHVWLRRIVASAAAELTGVH